MLYERDTQFTSPWRRLQYYTVTTNSYARLTYEASGGMKLSLASPRFKEKLLLKRKTGQAIKFFLMLLRKTKTSSACLVSKTQKKEPLKSPGLSGLWDPQVQVQTAQECRCAACSCNRCSPGRCWRKRGERQEQKPAVVTAAITAKPSNAGRR